MHCDKTPRGRDEGRRVAIKVSVRAIAAFIVPSALIVASACAPLRPPPPRTVRRVAVLPPCDATGAPLGGKSTSATIYGAPVESLGDILASAARDEITRCGIQVLDANLVEAASGARVPASPEMAAEIMAAAKLDATALFIRVRRWDFAYPTLRTDEIIASLDAMLVDPASRKVVWEVRRPTRPVPLHSQLMGGQADVVAAREVMREVFASCASRQPW
jgi:hypothetical protein